MQLNHASYNDSIETSMIGDNSIVVSLVVAIPGFRIPLLIKTLHFVSTRHRATGGLPCGVRCAVLE